MDLTKLSAEEKAKLRAQLDAEEKANREKIRTERETLKQLTDEFVEAFFPKLVEIASRLTLAKAELFENANTVLNIKREVFGMSEEAFNAQQSHSLSNKDFSKTIILGHNIVDGWDPDYTTAGLSKTKAWVDKQLTGQNQFLVNSLKNMLKPNKDGVLKASRVIELHNSAVEHGDRELIEAIEEIKAGYRPKKTTTFVKAKMKGDNGQDIWLNLSMSQA
jgi:hypothetical protein